MLFKINDKREESVRGLENSLRSVNLNGTIKVDGKYKDYIYVVKEVYYDRIENQYLLEIDNEIIKELSKKYHLYFELNERHLGEEVNESSLMSVHYYTIDLIDIRPKRFVDVTIKNFGIRPEELEKVDTMSIPNEILDVCDLLSEKYDKITMTMNSEFTISEISVEKTNDEILGVQFIQRDLYSKSKDAPYYFLFKRDLDLPHNRDEGDYFPVYVKNFSIPIINLRIIEDRINDLCLRLKRNHKESNN